MYLHHGRSSSSRPDTSKQTGSAANLDKPPCRRGGPYVFKCLDDTLVLGRVARPGADVGKAELLEKLADVAFVIVDAEASSAKGSSDSDEISLTHRIPDSPIVRRNMGRPRRSTIASTAGVRREFGRASSRRWPNLLSRRNEWPSTARISKRIAALAAEKGGVRAGDWHHQGRPEQQDSWPCR